MSERESAEKMLLEAIAALQDASRFATFLQWLEEGCEGKIPDAPRREVMPALLNELRSVGAGGFEQFMRELADKSDELSGRRKYMLGYALANFGKAGGIRPN